MQNHVKVPAQKMKFSIKDFFSKCDQTHSFLRIWSHLLKKSFMENIIFCAVLSVTLKVVISANSGTFQNIIKCQFQCFYNFQVSSTWFIFMQNFNCLKHFSILSSERRVIHPPPWSQTLKINCSM